MDIAMRAGRTPFECSYKGRQDALEMQLEAQAGCHLVVATSTGRVPFKCSYKDRKGAI